MTSLLRGGALGVLSKRLRGWRTPSLARLRPLPSSLLLHSRVFSVAPSPLNPTTSARSDAPPSSCDSPDISPTDNRSNSSDERLAAITFRLNSAQKAAVLAPAPGISICTAGPGSGKTRVLAHRVAYLLHRHAVPPTSILALTFTNKAGQEMKSRIGSLLNDTDVSSKITVGTFHSFCTRLLRTYGSSVLRELTGGGIIDRDFTIYDRDDSLRVIKTLLIDKKMGSLLPKDVLQIIAKRKSQDIMNSTILGQRWSGHMSTDWKPFAGVTASMLFKPELEDLYHNYTDTLRQSNAMDFDDLLLFGWRLLKDHPNIRRQIQDRYHHVLVDEYQDTNLPQYEIIRLMYCDKYLFEGDDSDSSRLAKTNFSVSTPHYCRGDSLNKTSDRTLFVVGDANQAIYSWRGALPENMNRIRSDYPTLASLYGLKENYRCSPSIAAVANALLGSHVTVSATASPAKLESTELNNNSDTTESTPVQVILTKNDIEQAKTTANILKKHASLCKSRAVLYRTNAQSRQIEAALMDANIVYKIIGGLKFFERREVKDVIGYLKLLANPYDVGAVRRTINTPLRGIGPVTQEAFFSWVRNTTRNAEDRGHVVPTILDHLHAVTLLADHDENDTDTEMEIGECGAPFDIAHFETDETTHYDDVSSTNYSEDIDFYMTESDNNDLDSQSDSESGDIDFDLHQELSRACPLTRRELNVLKKYAQLIIQFDNFARTHSLTDLTRRIITSVGMADHVKKISKGVDEERDRWENLNELLRGTARYSPRFTTVQEDEEDMASLPKSAGKKNLVKFIEHVALFTTDDGSADTLNTGQPEADEPVQLMTIHSSKGLEFDMVIVSGMEEGCLPLVRRQSTSDRISLEEERRLAYVAMTRAKSHLILTHRKRSLHLRGSKLVFKKTRASRFLNPLANVTKEHCIFVGK